MDLTAFRDSLKDSTPPAGTSKGLQAHYGKMPKVIGKLPTRWLKIHQIRKAPGYMPISIASKETNPTPVTGMGGLKNRTARPL